jgi:hypothetical protein
VLPCLRQHRGTRLCSLAHGAALNVRLRSQERQVASASASLRPVLQTFRPGGFPTVRSMPAALALANRIFPLAIPRRNS